MPITKELASSWRFIRSRYTRESGARSLTRGLHQDPPSPSPSTLKPADRLKSPSKIAFPIEVADDSNITLHLAALKQLQHQIRKGNEWEREKKSLLSLSWKNKVTLRSLDLRRPSSTLLLSIIEFANERNEVQWWGHHRHVLGIRSHTWEGHRLVFML